MASKNTDNAVAAVTATEHEAAVAVYDAAVKSLARSKAECPTLRDFVLLFLGKLPADVVVNVPDVREALKVSPWAEQHATACAFGNPRIRQLMDRMWRAGQLDAFDADPALGNGRSCTCFAIAEAE
jgi:hypothetical protein